MIRVVLTVLLAVALLAAISPAVERAGVSRGNAAAGAAADELASEARALLADSDAVARGVAGARRLVALELPEGGFASASLVTFRLERGATANRTAGARIVWRVAGGTRQVRRLPGVDIRPATGTGRAVTFETGGTHTLVMELVRRDGHRVLRVHRRGFK